MAADPHRSTGPIPTPKTSGSQLHCNGMLSQRSGVFSSVHDLTRRQVRVERCSDPGRGLGRANSTTIYSGFSPLFCYYGQNVRGGLIWDAGSPVFSSKPQLKSVSLGLPQLFNAGPWFGPAVCTSAFSVSIALVQKFEMMKISQTWTTSKPSQDLDWYESRESHMVSPGHSSLSGFPRNLVKALQLHQQFLRQSQ